MDNPQKIYKWRATDIESIKAHEEACVLPRFDSDVAWELGTVIRVRCQHDHESPAIVYIAHANSTQLLFFAASRPGTVTDDMHWVKRKEATVLRWGVSSLRMRLQIRDGLSLGDSLNSFKSKYELADTNDSYSLHGGGFPIMVRNVEGVVGVIAVHGTPDDHRVVVESIQEYLARNNGSRIRV